MMMMLICDSIQKKEKLEKVFRFREIKVHFHVSKFVEYIIR